MLLNVLYETRFCWTKVKGDGQTYRHTYGRTQKVFYINFYVAVHFCTVLCLCKFPMSWREDYSASFQADLSSN